MKTIEIVTSCDVCDVCDGRDTVRAYTLRQQGPGHHMARRRDLCVTCAEPIRKAFGLQPQRSTAHRAA